MEMGAELKAFFVDELKRTDQERIARAARAESEASQEADRVRSDARCSPEAKDAALQGRMAKGHRRRRKQAVAEMERLIAFAEGAGVARFKQSARVDLGALVDVRIEYQTGEDERTLFFLPVGAGVELHDPVATGSSLLRRFSTPWGERSASSRAGSEGVARSCFFVLCATVRNRAPGMDSW